MGTAQFLSAQDVSDLWGITKRRVQSLCVNNRIPGAFKIGNMWAIPADAVKPKDARVREHNEETESLRVSIRKSRRNLRSLVDIILRELCGAGFSSVGALKVLVVLFASKLLERYGVGASVCMEKCEAFFGVKLKKTNLDMRIAETINKFISENAMCLDDSLSWAYQFATKKSDVFKYNDTQFFTEKYMINTLVNSVHIDADSIVIDPACGGCNFLLYSFETIVELSQEQDALDRANYALSRLYGYEIDPFLAHVGAFNLKLKAMSYIVKERNISIEDFNLVHPLVFYPEKDTVSGFLDMEWEKQFVVNCDTQKTIQLIDAFDGANIVVTNPPFRTIKGMPSDQKEYLQQYYPMAKCDMCNAFIERVLDVLPEGGQAAMVTQNSWMYLDSFTSLRSRILGDYTIDSIWELGSNAFYDLSGEKVNVALVSATKTKPGKSHIIELGLFRNMSIDDIELALEEGSIQMQRIMQMDVLKNIESRFDLVSTDHLRNLQVKCDQYKNFAVPMQGTSTGDAKNLIDYYWKHIGDEDWVLVSKGGGYSRFEGLNSYSVKWGKNGEYIKSTKGSAIRNASYFEETQLVFSDTGTAGLNVRVLLPGQIFVASGPGIRITRGNILAHLAFLNSRFAAFFVRLLSPKLTIAAGYIGKIPVKEGILSSIVLEKCAKKCLESKKHRLFKRPTNVEFAYFIHNENRTIEDASRTWFDDDIKDEWTQLLNEKKAEDFITKEMNLSDADLKAMDNYIGNRLIFSISGDSDTSLAESDVTGVLSVDCFPRRTKASKKSLGSDGLIEYVSQIKGISCEKAYTILGKHFDWFKDSYVDLYMQALVLSALKFKEAQYNRMTADKAVSEMGLLRKADKDFAKKWFKEKFNTVHCELFEGKPLYSFNSLVDEFEMIKE